MDINAESLVVKNNEARSRFEIDVNGEVAELVYSLDRDRITLVHTAVPKALEGHGIAGKLAKYGLDHARSNGLEVVVACPYVASYIERHPEYEDLVVDWQTPRAG